MQHLNNETLKGIFDKAYEEASVGLEMQDDSLEKLTKYMKEMNINDIINLNPINDNIDNVLNNILNGKWINNPQNEFKSCLSPNAIDNIKKQVKLHSKCIENCIKHGINESNSKMIDRKLNELIKCSGIVDLVVIDNAVQDCIKMIDNTWQDICNRHIRQLKHNVQNNSDLESFEKNVKQFGNFTQSNDVIALFNAYLVNIKDIITIKMLDELLMRQFSEILNKCNIKDKCEIYFNKVKIMVDIFPKLKDLYLSRIKELENNINKILSKCNEVIDNYSYNQCDRLFESLDKFNMINNMKIKELNYSIVVSKTMKKLINKIEIGKDEVSKILSKTSVNTVQTSESLDTCRKIVNFIAKARNNSAKNDSKNKNEINNNDDQTTMTNEMKEDNNKTTEEDATLAKISQTAYQECKATVSRYFCTITDYIVSSNTDINSDGVNDELINKISRLMKEIVYISDFNGEIKQLSVSYITKSKNKIIKYLENIQGLFNDNMNILNDNIFNNHESECKLLVTYFNIVKKCELSFKTMDLKILSQMSDEIGSYINGVCKWK